MLGWNDKQCSDYACKRLIQKQDDLCLRCPVRITILLGYIPDSQVIMNLMIK